MSQQGVFSNMILDLLPSLTGAMRVTAEFYLSSSCAEVADLNIRQAAQRCGVSTSSITRFIGMLGFSSYSAFQRVLKQNEDVLIEKFPTYQGITPESDTREICESVCTRTMAALEETFALIASQNMELVCNTIKHASKIYIMANGRSKMAAESFRYRLSYLGIYAQLLDSWDHQRWAAGYATKDDVLICFSLRTRRAGDLQILRRFNARQVPIVLITAVENSEMAALADHLIRIPPEEDVEQGHTFSSITQIAIGDCLYMMIGQDMKEQGDQILEKTSIGLHLDRLDHYENLPTKNEELRRILDFDILEQ